MAGFNYDFKCLLNQMHIVPPLFLWKIKVKAKVICKEIAIH